MTLRSPVRVVVLGGGTAGWMTAAALSHHLRGVAKVTLVESEDIGIVGVGEATLPHIRHFVEQLGINEADFMEATQATFKLGIDFQNFGAIGERYIHPFGTYGRPLAGIPFHNFWLRHRAGKGPSSGSAIEPWSLGIAAARAGRFAIPDGSAPGDSYGYAYQFDATLFGPYLRSFSLARGTTRIEGRVAHVERNATGDVAALHLVDGRSVPGDLFIDCSGFRSLLLGETLGEEWEDWSHWLPCDRAAAMPCTSPLGEIEPYTRAVAMPGGWRWRIPLRRRVGNGYVFSSAHISEDEACDVIRASVEGEPLADPRILRFKAGRRKRSWVRNVVAVGLASGFLEPLESTSIYLAQMAVERLIELFPTDRIATTDRDEFNDAVDMEYDRIRDFLILHYHATRRTDTEFWNHVRTMTVPDTLSQKLALWRASARVAQYAQGLFLEPSWVAVCLGQGIVPDGWDPRAQALTQTKLDALIAQTKADVAERVQTMSPHAEVLGRYRSTHASAS